MADNSIKNAYKLSRNVYDEVLTQTGFGWKLYNFIFWGGVDDVAISKYILDKIPKDFSGKILDVPAGTARFTFEKYAALPLAEIICLDYSEDMLNQARARFEKHNLTNVQCIQGDVSNLPFEDETFDILVSMNGIHAFPNKKQAFSEIFRVLKKGGIFSGCFYIKGICRRTDFLVNTVLAPKGWFTPPFQNYGEITEILKEHYTTVNIFHQQSIVYFCCEKTDT